MSVSLSRVDEQRSDGDLEQSLRDERTRRREAERKLEDLTQRAELWRRRAEERTERIDRMLEAENQKKTTKLFRLARKVITSLRGESDLSVTVGTELAPSESSQPDSRSAAVRTRSRSWPAIKSVMAVSVVSDEGVKRSLSAFDVTSFTDASPADLERADLVVVDPMALANLSSEARDRFEAWSEGPARQPLVVWTSVNDLSTVSQILGATDVVVSSDQKAADWLGVEYFPGSFDPGVHHPRGSGSSSGHNRRDIHLEDQRGSLESPSLDLIESAASGSGFTSTPGADTAARRWAYRNHSPWVRASQLLGLVGLNAPAPVPRVAGILISHRSDSVPDAMRAIMRQTHPRSELVVGLHGASMTPAIEEALAEATIPVELITFDRYHTLGDCLNLAISRTSAPVLAKIDDDDHYGPAHLEDSFHAMAYSGAQIIGKGAQYTYISGRDQTVLRRPGQEEMFIDGSPNGATLVFRRDVWEDAGFPNRPRHVDTGFLRAARAVGANVYAASRWEFCYVRRENGHTWDAEDSVFLAGSEPAWEGFHPERVEVPDVESI